MTSPDPRAALADERTLLVQQLREKALWREDIHHDLHIAAADMIEALARDPSPYSGAELPVAREKVCAHEDCLNCTCAEEAFCAGTHYRPTTLPRDAERETGESVGLETALLEALGGMRVIGSWDAATMDRVIEIVTWAFRDAHPTLPRDAERCDWPAEPFTFHDEPGEHDPCYVVMPGGAMLPINHHAGKGVDIARAKFIVAACNAALHGNFIRNGLFRLIDKFTYIDEQSGECRFRKQFTGMDLVNAVLVLLPPFIPPRDGVDSPPSQVGEPVADEVIVGHTPTPWRVGPDSVEPFYIAGPDKGMTAFVGVVPTRMQTGRDEAENRANAKLIVAAVNAYTSPNTLPRDAEEADFKLTYIKRWRTIVKLPAKYADEIRDALALPRDAERETIERCARIVEQWSLPTVQTASMWLVDQAGIAAEIRALPSIPVEREAVCAKCGCKTEGEVAWVNNEEWCHPCADATPSTTSVMPDEGKQK
jgi:hypothetical protein